MVPVFRQCESHPGRPLRQHLLDVAERLHAHSPDSSLRLAGLFHDIGKATAFFQGYLHGKNPPQDLRRHSDVGGLWLLEYIQPTTLPTDTCTVIQAALAYLFIRRHHGRLDDLLDGLPLPRPDRVETERLEQQLVAMDCDGAAEWISEILGHPVQVPRAAKSAVALRIQVWQALRSGCSEQEAMCRFQRALQSFGWLIEADQDSAAGYPATAFVSSPKFASEHVEKFRAAGDFAVPSDPTMVSARELVYESAVAHAAVRPGRESGLWTLTVPTGAGKTLAALGWALKRREIRIAAGRPSCPVIYALPFTSIIDQTAMVLRRIWANPTEDESLLAIHHHLSEPGEIAERGEESLARSWVQGWRADIVCTTFVQLVNAMFHGRAADARRFSKLAGAVVILDEVQAFPAELWPVLRIALASLGRNFGTDLLLVTATQPALFDNESTTEIGPGNIPAYLQPAFDRYDVQVAIANPTSLASLETIVATATMSVGARSCLLILNTVNEALDVYQRIQQSGRFEQCTVFHLSTNLRPKDRQRILQEITTCREPHVVVATQVVEAGVDLSFDLVFRALAPLDAIVQAAGRCNRHGIGPPGRVFLFDLEGNSAHMIYGAVHISLVREILGHIASNEGDARIRESSLRNLVSDYFSELRFRIQTDTARRVLDAVSKLEFAALRGEGQDRERAEKRVQLIEDQQDRVSHFVETDESDCAVWRELANALVLNEPKARRQRLRSLRSAVCQRIVEVPQRYSLAERNESTGLVHVPFADASTYYDTRYGWRRE